MTRIDTAVRILVRDRDQGCVGHRLGMPGVCFGRYELDHVRAGGMGLKSRSTPDNLVTLCSGAHRIKTENGRIWRPVLLAYLSRFYGEAA